MRNQGFWQWPYSVWSGYKHRTGAHTGFARIHFLRMFVHLVCFGLWSGVEPLGDRLQRVWTIQTKSNHFELDRCFSLSYFRFTVLDCFFFVVFFSNEKVDIKENWIKENQWSKCITFTFTIFFVFLTSFCIFLCIYCKFTS